MPRSLVGIRVVISRAAPALIAPASQASPVAANSNASFSPSATADRDSPVDRPAVTSSQRVVEVNPLPAATSSARTCVVACTARAWVCDASRCSSAVTASSSASDKDSRNPVPITATAESSAARRSCTAPVTDGGGGKSRTELMTRT